MVAVKPKLPLKAKNNKNKAASKIEKLNKKTKPQKLQASPLPVQKTKAVKTVAAEVKKEAAPATLKKKVKYVMPSQSVTEDVANSCLSALLDVVVKHDKQKNVLFDDEKPIFAEIHCIKIQNTRGNIKL